MALIEEVILTPDDAAKRKHVNVITVYRAMKRGDLPHRKILGRYALTPADVDSWQPDTWGGSRGGGRPRKQPQEAGL